jgi:hypothetical protein
MTLEEIFKKLKELGTPTYSDTPGMGNIEHPFPIYQKYQDNALMQSKIDLFGDPGSYDRKMGLYDLVMLLKSKHPNLSYKDIWNRVGAGAEQQAGKQFIQKSENRKYKRNSKWENQIGLENIFRQRDNPPGEWM